MSEISLSQFSPAQIASLFAQMEKQKADGAAAAKAKADKFLARFGKVVHAEFEFAAFESGAVGVQVGGKALVQVGETEAGEPIMRQITLSVLARYTDTIPARKVKGVGVVTVSQRDAEHDEVAASIAQGALDASNARVGEVA